MSPPHAFPFTAEQCQQIVALTGSQPNFVGNTLPQSNLSGIALNVISSPNSVSWIVDSGATDHIVSSP